MQREAEAAAKQLQLEQMKQVFIIVSHHLNAPQCTSTHLNTPHTTSTRITNHLNTLHAPPYTPQDQLARERDALVKQKTQSDNGRAFAGEAARAARAQITALEQELAAFKIEQRAHELVCVLVVCVVCVCCVCSCSDLLWCVARVAVYTRVCCTYVHFVCVMVYYNMWHAMDAPAWRAKTTTEPSCHIINQHHPPQSPHNSPPHTQAMRKLQNEKQQYGQQVAALKAQYTAAQEALAARDREIGAYEGGAYVGGAYVGGAYVGYMCVCGGTCGYVVNTVDFAFGCESGTHG